MADDLFLFLDFETTSLDPMTTTVLEIGWTVTGPDLVQRTPLRSRFAALTAASMRPAVVPGDRTGWAEVAQVVRDMHRESGLVDEWRSAPELSRLTQVADLSRVLVDDLLAAGWVGGKRDIVYLAGAGVSHYDQAVIGALGALRKPSLEPILHYRTADSSVAATLLGVEMPKTPYELGTLVDKYAAPGVLDLDTDGTTRRLAFPDGTINVAELRNHRAADDVAFSLVFARCLRGMVS